MRITAKELNLIARTLFAEAATEGLDGQMAVAQTMFDQLSHNIIGADGTAFGTDIESVIRNAYTEPTDQDIRGSTCMEAAIRVFIEEQKVFPEHYVYFFMSDRGSAYWRNYWNSHYTMVARLKNHTFWGIEIPDSEKEESFARFVAEVDDPDGWIFVYEKPDTRGGILEEYPQLNNTNLVEVLAAETDTKGDKWYLISIAGAYAGYVKAEQLRKK